MDLRGPSNAALSEPRDPRRGCDASPAPWLKEAKSAEDRGGESGNFPRDARCESASRVTAAACGHQELPPDRVVPGAASARACSGASGRRWRWRSAAPRDRHRPAEAPAGRAASARRRRRGSNAGPAGTPPPTAAGRWGSCATAPANARSTQRVGGPPEVVLPRGRVLADQREGGRDELPLVILEVGRIEPPRSCTTIGSTRRECMTRSRIRPRWSTRRSRIPVRRGARGGPDRPRRRGRTEC